MEFAKWSNALISDFRAGRLVPVLSDVTAAEAVEAPERVRELHQEMLGLAGAVLAIYAAATRKNPSLDTAAVCAVLEKMAGIVSSR